MREENPAKKLKMNHQKKASGKCGIIKDKERENFKKKASQHCQMLYRV